ncbi:FAD-dependent oxidoreductase [Rheinheimera sediminis]|uniref:FAD-dependent oxidoreductase n=1 Tax=Rheinheimera sp. YQF-1 TaxID=2499626 RepID=UPI000FDA019E|nr:FAD-dependent oxidoreductase [Rheinheimera sp. YQF-1]RVT46125.1 FAD-dependent oxidoreductase [Rheinheimera sp. YQF-1]
MLDIVIVGGGMVGASVALKLSRAGLEVGLIEKQPVSAFDPHSAIDLRVSAINRRSEQWLTDLGAWSLLQQWRLCPYKRLQAFEDEQAGLTFHADEVALTHLGHIVENNLIQQALWANFPANLQLFCPASVTGFVQHSDYASVSTVEFGELKAKLVIAADGGQSQLRQLAQIGVSGWQYQQSCLVVTVNTEYEQQDITWQQFNESGPRAFLPLPGKQGSLVWYDHHHKIKQLAALSKAALAEQIQHAFPAKLGKITVEQVASFPLARVHAKDYVKGRLVLVGDAAHSINPLAGQGVNLGFADAMLLSELLEQAFAQGQDLAGAALLKQYQSTRQRENALMMSAMDLFYQNFSSSLPPVRFLRQLGLAVAEKAGPLKHWVSRYAVGIN